MLADREGLHEQLKKLVPDLAVAQSIWIYDARGDVLVSSAVQPPAPQNFSDRDSIRAQRSWLMTGYFRNAIVRQGRLDPRVDLVKKPLIGDELAAMVRKTLDGWSSVFRRDIAA